MKVMINAKEKRAVLLEEIMKSSSWHERSELVTPGAICLRYWFLKARKDQLSKRQGNYCSNRNNCSKRKGRSSCSSDKQLQSDDVDAAQMTSEEKDMRREFPYLPMFHLMFIIQIWKW